MKMMNRQEHLLVILMEECAELQKECAKALRFGLDDHAPDSIDTNEEKIYHEFNHVMAIGEMLKKDSIVPISYRMSIVNEKKKAVEKWLLYSKEKGTLTDE